MRFKRRFIHRELEAVAGLSENMAESALFCVYTLLSQLMSDTKMDIQTNN